MHGYYNHCISFYTAYLIYYSKNSSTNKHSGKVAGHPPPVQLVSVVLIIFENWVEQAALLWFKPTYYCLWKLMWWIWLCTVRQTIVLARYVKILHWSTKDCTLTLVDNNPLWSCWNSLSQHWPCTLQCKDSINSTTCMLIY